MLFDVIFIVFYVDLFIYKALDSMNEEPESLSEDRLRLNLKTYVTRLYGSIFIILRVTLYVIPF